MRFVLVDDDNNEQRAYKTSEHNRGSSWVSRDIRACVFKLNFLMRLVRSRLAMNFNQTPKKKLDFVGAIKRRRVFVMKFTEQ